MLEQTTLREHFETLLQRQHQAAAMYAELAATTADPALRRQAEQLQRDKLRHIRLTERLMEIIEA